MTYSFDTMLKPRQQKSSRGSSSIICPRSSSFFMPPSGSSMGQNERCTNPCVSTLATIAQANLKSKLLLTCYGNAAVDDSL